MHSPFYSIFFAFFLLQVASVHAGRSSNEHSYARRSLVNGHKRRLAAEGSSFEDSSFDGNLVENALSQVRKRQDGLLDGLIDPVGEGLGNLGDGLGSALGVDNGGKATTALLPPTSIIPSSSVPPGPTSGGSSEPTSAASSTEPTSGSSSESTSSAPSSSGGPSSTSGGSSEPTIVVPSSTTEPPSSSTSTDGGIISSIIGGLTSVLNPTTETTIESTEAPTSEPTSGPTSEPTTEPTSEPVSTDITSAPPSTPTSTTDGGILSSILDPVTSVLLPPTSTAESTAESSVESTAQPTEAPSSQPTDAPTSTTDGGILSSILDPVTSGPLSTAESSAESTAQPTEAPSSQPTDAPTSTTDGGILSGLSSVLSGVSSDLSSVFNPPSSTVNPSSEITPPPSSSGEPSGPNSSEPPSSVTDFSSSVSSVIPSSVSSEPPSSVTDFPSSVSSDFPSSVNGSSSSSFSISFPGGDNNSSSSAFSSESGPTSSTFIPVATTTSVPFSVNSDFSFILTESDLAFTSVPTKTSWSMTNPDEPTTTLGSGSSAPPAATFTAAPLPPGLPSRIYPKNGYKTGDDVAGFTLISLLFNQELNWPFVANDDRSSFQIFGYMPAILDTALGLSGDRVTKTWMLQVYQPSSYRGPSDSAELGTTYLAYIPTDQVDNLAAMIKAPQSAFYTGVDIPAARSLAVRVNSGYSLLSVEDPNGGDGGQTRNGSGSSNSSGGADRTRQDAIIGVVSALGAIAVLVLAFLGYKWYQRRQEAAHRRLSDPAPVPGARPEGREFDQDSVGGQRRRSFYFAEDSLRGYQHAPQEEYSYHYDQNGARTSPVGGMTQRRNVVPAAISQPILRESSMNW